MLGDAAHSMVPFFGQGLNCGLEDVRVLVSTILSSGFDVSVPIGKTGDVTTTEPVDEGMETILERYTRTRHEDLVAICDLAMQN